MRGRHHHLVGRKGVHTERDPRNPSFRRLQAALLCPPPNLGGCGASEIRAEQGRSRAWGLLLPQWLERRWPLASGKPAGVSVAWCGSVPGLGARGPEVDRCVGPTGRWLDAPQGKVGVPGWPLRWGWGGDDGARPHRHGGHLGPRPDPGPRPRALHGSPVPSKPSSSPSPPLLTPKEDTPLHLTAGPR